MLNQKRETEVEIMETYTIERTDARPLRFKGELLAEASSYRHDNNTRWTELALYKTSGGKYICEVRARTIWQGERDFIRADAVADEAAVVDYFEPSWVARMLFDAAGIDDAVEVD